MKKFLEYKWLIVTLLALGIYAALLPDRGTEAVIITGDGLVTMLTVVPPVFVILGLIDIWVPKETMVKYIGSEAGIKGTILAFLLGSTAAGPLYIAFPVAAVLIKKDASLFNVMVFIGAWSTTKIPLLLFELDALGVAFTSVRLALSITGILFIAWVINNRIDSDLYAKIKERVEALNE